MTTRYLKIRADEISCPAAPAVQYNLADIYGVDGYDALLSDSDIDPGRPVLDRVPGPARSRASPVVVEARQEGVPDDAMIRGLDQLRESLTFGFRRE